MEHRFADCVLDDARLTLMRDGAPVAVEPKVFDLIHLLVRNAGDLVTRDQMIEEVWQGRIISESAISACIAAARRALGDDGKTQAVIRTVARRGLMLVADVSAPSLEAPANEPSSAIVQRVRYIKGTEGESIAYAVNGNGPPLLRVDAPAWDIETEWNSRYWRDATQALAQSYRLARFTRRDFKKAGTGAPCIDHDAMAEEIGLVADAVGFDRFALFSQSGGVHAALRFAVRHPTRVSRLVIAGGYVEGRSRRSGTDVSSDAFRRLITEGWRAEADGIGAAFMLAYLPEGPLDAIMAAARNFQGSVSKETELALRDAINTVDNTALLPLVRCPTLIVHARHDAVHPLSEARKMAAAIPDAELVVLETANHLPLPGNPAWDVFLATFHDFMGAER
ncbi:alpha/beta hydrolase [Defluviimonas sp. WL0002]|uniref:Alpha/beta hydrolase n=1 Tax=Albidovulum marisflavi TaxID=2984159 RepID=A0ABT2ZC36_9RHOB|nr:alpha/beta hydrolase [Defluviimonas sp. WL0002]MCV2868684.1 alpha/beta hydrolase [Defluviimonas sp. WL0002]